MVKNYNNRRWWENDPKVDVKIFWELEDGSKTFGQLLKTLGCGTQTLTNYLKNLGKAGKGCRKDCIERKKRGRTVFYTLIRSNAYVRQMLGWDWLPSTNVRIHKRVELDKLNEEQFIASWLNSIKFTFLNIIQVYRLIGKKTKESNEDTDSIKMMHNFLEAYVSDLADTITYNGELMAKEIKLGILDPERIWEVRNKLLKRIKDEIMNF